MTIPLNNIKNNVFTVSFETFSDEQAVSYLIEFRKTDAKDLVVQFLKLQYGKIPKIKFCDRKGNAVSEWTCQDGLSWRIAHRTVALSQTAAEQITSFLLDATDEYMNYDHIDVTLPTDKIDVCLAII